MPEQKDNLCSFVFRYIQKEVQIVGEVSAVMDGAQDGLWFIPVANFNDMVKKRKVRHTEKCS